MNARFTVDRLIDQLRRRLHVRHNTFSDYRRVEKRASVGEDRGVRIDVCTERRRRSSSTPPSSRRSSRTRASATSRSLHFGMFSYVVCQVRRRSLHCSTCRAETILDGDKLPRINWALKSQLIEERERYAIPRCTGIVEEWTKEVEDDVRVRCYTCNDVINVSF